MASCESLAPTVISPATALYAMDLPPTVTEPSVVESGGSAVGFMGSVVAVVVVVVVLSTLGACAKAAEAMSRERKQAVPPLRMNRLCIKSLL
jgi:hypothetical protein